jgi:predicted nucleotidyltransferase
MSAERAVSVEASRPQPLSGPLGQIVRQRRRELVAAAEAHGAARLRVFGSVARGEDRADSDVDLLVDLPAGLGLFGFGRLLEDLSACLTAPRSTWCPQAT